MSRAQLFNISVSIFTLLHSPKQANSFLDFSRTEYRQCIDLKRDRCSLLASNADHFNIVFVTFVYMVFKMTFMVDWHRKTFRFIKASLFGLREDVLVLFLDHLVVTLINGFISEL